MSNICPECSNIISRFTEDKYGEICHYIACISPDCASKYRVGPFATEHMAIAAWERLTDLHNAAAPVEKLRKLEIALDRAKSENNKLADERKMLKRTLTLMEHLWVRFGHLIPAILLLRRERRTKHKDKIVKYIEDSLDRECADGNPSFTKVELLQLVVRENKRFKKVYNERKSTLVVKLPRADV